MRMPFVSGIGYVWRPSDRFRNIPQVQGGQRESLRVAREILVGQGKCLCSWDNGQGFFFLPVPCALEAQTVINTSCFDWRFPRKREKVRQRSRCHQQTQNTRQKHQHKQPNTHNQKGHLGSWDNGQGANLLSSLVPVRVCSRSLFFDQFFF